MSLAVHYDVDMVDYEGQPTLRLKLKLIETSQSREMDYHSEKVMYFYGKDFTNGDNLHVLLDEGKKSFHQKFGQLMQVNWQPSASIPLL